MVPAIRERFEQSEQLRQQLLVDVQDLDEAQMAFRPAYDAWSIVQVLQHLMLVESAVLQYLEKKLQATTFPNAGFGAKIRSKLLNVALRTPVKVKAPQGLAQPVRAMTFWDVAKRWNDNRDALESMLGKLTENHLDSAIYKHLIAGYLNVFQMFDFIDNHLRHHIIQVNRIKAAKDFPQIQYE